MGQYETVYIVYSKGRDISAHVVNKIFINGSVKLPNPVLKFLQTRIQICCPKCGTSFYPIIFVECAPSPQMFPVMKSSQHNSLKANFMPNKTQNSNFDTSLLPEQNLYFA